MEMDNTGNHQAKSSEEEFGAVIDKYLTLVNDLGRVPADHPIHEQVRISRERLISGLKKK